MSDEDKRNRTASNRTDARAALEDARKKETEIKGEKLDDSDVQDKIMNPGFSVVEIGDEQVKLYPLSGFSARRLVALTNQVMASAAGPGSYAMRVGGALVESYLDRFLPLLAESTFQKPTDVDGKQVMKLADRFNKATATIKGGMVDLPQAFQTMLEINGVDDFFNQRQAEMLKELEAEEKPETE